MAHSIEDRANAVRKGLRLLIMKEKDPILLSRMACMINREDDILAQLYDLCEQGTMILKGTSSGQS